MYTLYTPLLLSDRSRGVVDAGKICYEFRAPFFVFHKRNFRQSSSVGIYINITNKPRL